MFKISDHVVAVYIIDICQSCLLFLLLTVPLFSPGFFWGGGGLHVNASAMFVFSPITLRIEVARTPFVCI